MCRVRAVVASVCPACLGRSSGGPGGLGGGPSQVPGPPACGGISVGPGAFNEGATGLGLPGVGEGALTASLPAGIFRRGQASIVHPWPGRRAPCQVPACRHRGHRHGAWHAPSRLPRCDHGRETPGASVGSEVVLKTLQARNGLVDRSPRCLEAHVLGGSVTAHLRAPAARGRAPMRLAGRAARVPEEERVEAKCRGLQVTEGLFTRPAEGAEGLIGCLGALHGRESPRAPQPGQWHGIAAGRFHAVAGRVRQEGRGHTPAVIALLAQRALAPGATRPRFVDNTP